jgi:hypothetical protein
MGKARRGESAGGGGAHIAGGEVRESQGRDGVGGSLVGRRAVVLRAVNHHCSLGFVSSVRPASFSLHAGVWSGGVKGEGQGFTRTRLGWLTAGRTAPRHGSARGAVGMNRQLDTDRTERTEFKLTCQHAHLWIPGFIYLFTALQICAFSSFLLIFR